MKTTFALGIFLLAAVQTHALPALDGIDADPPADPVTVLDAPTSNRNCGMLDSGLTGLYYPLNMMQMAVSILHKMCMMQSNGASFYRSPARPVVVSCYTCHVTLLNTHIKTHIPKHSHKIPVASTSCFLNSVQEGMRIGSFIP